MAIDDYVNPMDRGDQGLIMDYAGDAETQRGICRMLSINWIIDCATPGAPLPNQVWHAMKAKGPVYFKQIGQQQKGYSTYFSNSSQASQFDSVRDCIQLASRNGRNVAHNAPNETATTAANFAGCVTSALGVSTTAPHLAVIRFNVNNGNGAGHCIAAARAGGFDWIFDPNYGVMKVDPGKGQTMAGAIGEIFTAYTLNRAYVFPVT